MLRKIRLIYWYREGGILNRMMQKQQPKAQREFFYITLSIFIVTAAWVGFNIYNTAVTSTISSDLQIQIIPISAGFDTVTINTLRSRIQVSPLSGFTYSAPRQEEASSPGTISKDIIQSHMQHTGL